MKKQESRSCPESGSTSTPERSFEVFSRILIVEKEETLRERLECSLSVEGYSVHCAHCGDSALTAIENSPFDVVLCDLEIPGREGFDLIPQIARLLPDVPIILISAHGSQDLAGEAIQRGAYDYLAEPFQPDEIRLTLRKALEREEMRRRKTLLEREISRTVGDRAIVAASNGMIALLELLEKTAAFSSTTLVTGENGTGKEVIARAIHLQSPRRDAPFVAVRCGGIPEHLLDSQLFGHVGGTLTAASRGHRGLFAAANKGSLFLDEIAEMPAGLQVKLLRTIEEEEIRPLGGRKALKIDVRVIAATSRDLEFEISEGRFREDLFDRLNVVRLEIPPLRKRRQDIPLLVDHFLSQFRDNFGKNVRSVSDEALDLLVGYRWPGNVRELENMIERAMILTDDDTIEISALPRILSSAPSGEAGLQDAPDEHEDFSLKRARQVFETELIRRALRRVGGNRTHAAKLLQISHRTLLYKIKDYGIRD